VTVEHELVFDFPVAARIASAMPIAVPDGASFLKR
jgi:hypothetical protein